MTAKQVWEYIMVETAKQRVQPMLLEDFNYLFNKTILMYTDKVYHAFAVNQKIDDNLRVLTGANVLDVEKCNWYPTEFFNGLSGAHYECQLPLDYLHILSVMCIFEVKKTKDCYDVGDYVKRAATRMTSDIFPVVNEDFYNRPSYRKPYYIIKNVNQNEENPTNPYKPETGKQSLTRKAIGTDGPLPTTIDISGQSVSLIEKPAVNRYGNVSPIRMEIRYGNDDQTFELHKIAIDYLKTPQHIRLTQKQLDLVEDTSQILEFPDITCQEIINDFTAIYMENTADQRLATSMQVNNAVQNGTPAGVPTQVQPQQA